ncbi:NAD(P)/FAD-dependent oxidoreductase [Orenia marismortui]|uniref:NADH:ubiquinone reductase (non-electrogenic) n=1 Tax=Orenia marismortui TaxID=46469 RepID=A0A4R8H9D0_9FIRM|nr:NAD(P)/FAD-dependent oxidoreductase [Orenia marismortui]TDX52114.1 NADH dehydrogenase FAD-containing subunit [Orenia marismortui]
MNKNIVILGAGYAGIEAAKDLNKRFRKNPDVQITLIDQNPHHTLLTELHEVAGNRVSSSGLKVSLSKVFDDTKVNLVEDKITDIDPQTKQLSSDNNEYNYDYLVLGVGSEPAYFKIPGMEENCFTLWSLEDAKKINSHVRRMFSLASTETDPEKRQELLTFIIGGGGFTGIEMAGELAEWVEELCEKYEISREEASIKVIEARDEILTVLSKKRVAKAEQYLSETLGVELLTRSTITNVEKNKIIINDDNVSFKGKKEIKSNTLIWTGGVKANSFVKKLGLEINHRDRLVVNEYLQTSIQNIYAIGDNASILWEEGRELPQLVESALQTGQSAAYNIYADITDAELKKFNANLHGVMVSIGSNYAVAELKPIPSLTIPLVGFLAMMTKHFVNMHYLFGVNGFSLIWEYIEHQFGEVKGGIGMLVRHFSKKSGTFWLAFLRVFLGVRFLIEGIHKLQEGWLFGSDEHLISGASSMLWSEGTPELYITFAKTFIEPNQVLFQKIMVITEIGVGLSLIFGCLTIIGALVAMTLSANFIIGGLGSDAGIWEPVWLFLISVAMLSNAGKAFGIDYYLLPWIFNLSKKPAKHL